MNKEREVKRGGEGRTIYRFSELVEQQLGLGCRLDVTGARVTTFCIGGPLEYWVEVQDEVQLAGLVRLARDEGVACRVIGRGSNLLIADGGVAGVTIKLGDKFSLIRPAGSDLGGAWRITQRSSGAPNLMVGAAAYLPKVSRELSEAGLSGLEFAGGIPGTVGGAICMNAGAHGSEMAEVVDKICFVTAQGDFEQVAYRELNPCYRYGGLPDGAIVTGVELCLVEGDLESIRQRRESCLEARRKSQPLHLPSAGSVFRNPSSELTAGRLLEECGLKGAAEGGAVVSEMHANWIVNPSKRALALDVKRLIQRCKDAAAGVGADLIQEVKEWA